MEKDDIAFVERIIKELDEKLSNMTKEERDKLFKKYGLKVENISNSKEEKHQ